MKTYFYHGELPDSTRYTIAGVYEETEAVLKIGASVCSDKDQFHKALGRARAGGRALASRPSAMISLYYDKSFKLNYWKEDEGKVFIKLISIFLSGIGNKKILLSKLYFDDKNKKE